MQSTAGHARMTDLGALIFAALGVQTLVSAAWSLDTVAFALLSTLDPHRGGVDLVTVLLGLVDGGLRIGLGAALILSRHRIARSVTNDAAIPGISRDDALAVGLAAIGIWFLMHSGTQLMRGIAGGIDGRAQAAHLAACALGVALFLGARGLTRLWHGIRTAR